MVCRICVSLWLWRDDPIECHDRQPTMLARHPSQRCLANAFTVGVENGWLPESLLYPRWQHRVGGTRRSKDFVSADGYLDCQTLFLWVSTLFDLKNTLIMRGRLEAKIFNWICRFHEIFPAPVDTLSAYRRTGLAIPRQNGYCERYRTRCGDSFAWLTVIADGGSFGECSSGGNART